MEARELNFQNLTKKLLKPYEKRAATASAQFLRWFLENIFRTEIQDADDACVDKEQDKGVDGILINDNLEVIYIFQAKVKQKENAKLGDTDLKEFFGTLQQFSSAETVETVLNGQANKELKAALRRAKVKELIEAGYTVEGIFCCNVELNDDGKEYLNSAPRIDVYDAKRIANEFVDLDASTGINDAFEFNTSDTEVIKYETAESVSARIFLANALQLTHMKGIADHSLFSQNVRLALGNTKVNKSLAASIRDKTEHKNFPLYHNGITLLCSSIDESYTERLVVQDYVVVNGAQSLTSLLNSKSNITDDLRILVKVVALGDDDHLSEKITHNSNNQNAIKARDQKSNNPIQQRLKKEVANLQNSNFVLEVKQGEVNQNKDVLRNEDAGLALLAVDLGEPWTCHQKYKIMDDAHARIFGRSDVSGAKLVFCHLLVESMRNVLDEFKDPVFGHYNLTKYFLAHSVRCILDENDEIKAIFRDPSKLFEKNKAVSFVETFAGIASTTVVDLTAEIEEHVENNGTFDHKRDLKSPKWCKHMTGKLVSAYQKDVKRNKAEPIPKLFSDFT